MIRVRMEGDDLSGLADEILDDLRPRLEATAKAAAQIIVDKAKALLSRPAEATDTVRFRMRGKVFSKKGRAVEFAGTSHAGAAAGEPPRRRTGELHDSLTVREPKWSKYSLRVPYGSDLEWAGRMEFGGKDKEGRYLAPHPYLRPAEEQARGEAEKRLEDL